jgi:hypothetical protein
MKNKIILLLTLFFTVYSYSQVSVGPSHAGKLKKFKKGVLDKFKNTETIFVFSNIYEKDIYEKVLKNSWDVTPYKIVNVNDFNILDYIGEKYSIGRLEGHKTVVYKKSGSSTTYLHMYFDIKMFNGDKILEKLNKLSPKKRKKKEKVNNIIDMYSINLARFLLYPKDEFIHTSMLHEIDKIVQTLYTKDVFFNYKPGFLKNYFQKINSLLKDEKVYWMYKKDYLPELKNLANNKLYIPSYMTIKYNPWIGKDSKINDEEIKGIFKTYNYQYEIISDEELSKKIMNNQEFYYLRYARENSEKFLQVVNSKNGEIVYRNYIPGFSYNLKSKHIKDLNKKIAKALKNK